MANKAMGTMIIVLVIGALIGAVATYYYDQPKIQSAYSAGMQSVTPSAVTAAKLDFTWTSTYTFTGLVVNGTVPVKAGPVSHDLTIANVDTTYDATGVIITLKNPKTGASGLDADLTDAVNKITINVDYGSLTGINLLKTGTFYNRNIGDLPAGATITVSVSVTLEKNLKDQLTDGQAYSCELYVWQPNAGYLDTVDFTIQA